MGDQYRLTGLHLGKGGHGSVVHAVKGHVTYAVKQIPLLGNSSSCYWSCIESEVLHHRQLNHPHIAVLEEVVLTATHFNIVVEYVSGGELFDHICQQPTGHLIENEAR